MKLEQVNSVFFVGVGGIGMSALARYFNAIGKNVAGYDKTKTPLTEKLQQEGITVIYEDEISMVSDLFKNQAHTIIVKTPAVPVQNKILNHFISHKYTIYKRAEVLGLLSRELKSLCVAGTHGKTSISTMLAYLLNETEGCNAFLGGLSVNYNSNLVLNKKSHYVIIEADEYDRSFLQLRPDAALITAIDEDHLDIYGTLENVYAAFNDFIKLIKHEGSLIIHKELEESGKIDLKRSYYTYSLADENSDFYATNLTLTDGIYAFDFNCPKHKITNVKLGVPGKLNAENFIGAIALTCLAGADDDEIRTASAAYKGVKRRFEMHYNNAERVFIDDYAHHPAEIKKTLEAVKDIWPNKKLTVVFQPHLFSRTNDFYREFAVSLDMAEVVYLLDIYPAREEPIQGVSSELILKELKSASGKIVSKLTLLDELTHDVPELLLTMGAGDIDMLIEPIKSKVYHA